MATTARRRGTVTMDASAMNFIGGAPPKEEGGVMSSGKSSMPVDVRRPGITGTPVTVYGGYSRKGLASYNRAKPNQDAIVMTEDPVTNSLLLCVFDGHGPVGEKVSQFCQAHVPPLLFSRLAAGATPADALPGIVADVEARLFEDVSIDKSFSGTTAVIAVLQGNKLTVANVGDSRLTLGVRAGDTVAPSAVTIDQKPDLPEEKARILAAGGRVFAEQFDDDDVAGPVRVWLADMDIPGLAMARSVGDAVAKEAGVISTPVITERVLDSNTAMLVMASDGLWEFLSNEQVIALALERTAVPDCVCHLIETAVQQWQVEDEDIIDDTSVIVAYFNHYGEEGAADAAGSSAANGSSTPVASTPAATAAASATPAAATATPAAAAAHDSSAAAGADSGKPASEWVEHTDPSTNRSFWHNPRTGESTWFDPHKSVETTTVDEANVWEEHVDPTTSRKYYFNRLRRQSVWTKPTEREAVIRQMKIASTGTKSVVDSEGVSWEEHVDATSGRTYYYNREKRQSKWSLS